MSPDENHTAAQHDTDIVTLTGELDVSDVGQLRPHFEHIREGSGWLIVDVTDVTFMDSSVLGMLVQARTNASTAGRSVCLVGASRNVLRLFSVTNLDTVFPMYETLNDVPGFAG